jgi:EpsI family protein
VRLRLLALTATILGAAVAIGATSASETPPARRALNLLSPVIGEWNSQGDVQLDRDILDVLRADDHLSRLYARGQDAADLFIGYYATQRQGDTMHSPMNCLPAVGWQPLSMSRMRIGVGGGRTINANEYVIQKGLDTRLVIYWYQAHGRTIASEYASKFYLVLDSLRLHRSDAALVRVIVPERDHPRAERAAVDFVRALHDELPPYLPE